MFLPTSTTLALASLLFPSRAAGYVQFYELTSQLGFALSTTSNGSSTDLLFQLSVPERAGWGAVGLGDVMDGSLMFIVYPSSNKQNVTLSVRIASGHDTPSPISNVSFSVESSSIANSTMTANVICRNCTGAPEGVSLSMTSTKQPWIWAIGSGDDISSDANDAVIQQHSGYGTFFMSMPDTDTTSGAAIPTISGTSSNGSVITLPSSVPHLIVFHAILLAGSFVLLFPLGAIILRWFGGVKGHWIVQLLAALACTIGLVIAIIFSRMDPEFSSISKPHQVIGIVAVTALFAQAYFGYAHHRGFKKVGRRTIVSQLHLWTGRLLVPLGMFNAVLGFTLASQTSQAIGIAIVSIAVLVATYLLSYCAARRKPNRKASQQAPLEDIPLGSYNHLNDERNTFGSNFRSEPRAADQRLDM